MANYVRRYIKYNATNGKSFECGLRNIGYLTYNLTDFNYSNDTGAGKTPDAITSITFTCTCSAESHSTKQQLRIHLLDSSGATLASSSLVYFDWEVVNGSSTTDRPYFSINITDLTVSELNSLSAVKIEYNGTEVPSNYSNSKNAYFWANSDYPATLTINYSAADSYTVTYSKGNNNWTNWPMNQTKTPGVALTLSSLVPICGNSPTTTKTVILNYGGNGTANTTNTVKVWSGNWNIFSHWQEEGGDATYGPGASYTTDANIQLNVVGWWNENNIEGFTLPSPTRAGYDFKGWYSDSSGGTEVGKGGDLFTEISYSTIYAQWTPKIYTIQFDANGGSGSLPSTKSAWGDDASSAIIGNFTNGTNVPTRTGYVFRGWSSTTYYNSKRIAYADAYGGSADYSGTKATNPDLSWTYDTYCTNTGYTDPSRTLTLYAQWEKRQYTISYDANGGTGAPGAQTKTHGDALTLSTTKPSKSKNTSTIITTLNYNGNGTPDKTQSTTKITSYTFTDWISL